MPSSSPLPLRNFDTSDETTTTATAILDHTASTTTTTTTASAVRQRRRKRTTMLRQIQQHNRDEDEFMTALKQHEHNILDDLFRKNVTVLVILLFFGVIGIVYFRPRILFPNANKERLPRRIITTVYPRDLKIAKALPIVVLNYAIASPKNERERAAVQQVASQRTMITTAARGTRQLIQYNPIEHDDFVRKLITTQPGALDHFCGAGYQIMYQQQERRQVQSNSAVLDDMLLACLILSGTADGYVKHNVHVHAPLSRRTYGVAAQYRNQPRILSDLLWMPILERVGGKAQNQQTNQNNKPTPSTFLPQEMTKFLLATVEPSMSEWIYREEWEEFLYKAIQAEQDKWILFTAVCTEEERAELSSTTKFIATSCRQQTSCCWIFDTNMKPVNVK